MEFVTPNLIQIYFCIPEIFKTNISNILTIKSPFELYSILSQKAGMKCSYQSFLVSKNIKYFKRFKNEICCSCSHLIMKKAFNILITLVNKFKLNSINNL